MQLFWMGGEANGNVQYAFDGFIECFLVDGGVKEAISDVVYCTHWAQPTERKSFSELNVWWFNGIDNILWQIVFDSWSVFEWNLMLNLKLKPKWIDRVTIVDYYLMRESENIVIILFLYILTYWANVYYSPPSLSVWEGYQNIGWSQTNSM